jgi:diguanylate cyclase (GGDEF)-like protein/PAS domain S-box-containing protein
MFEVVNCIVVEHDLRLVALAASICGLSCVVAVTLLRRAAESRGVARWIWILICGAAGGFGVWGTHFIAMLAYTPGSSFAYEPALTLGSLAVAVVATSSAAACSIHLPRLEGSLAGGLLFGLGVPCMHFMGMAAVDFNGALEWNRSIASVSVALSVLLAISSFWATLSIRSSKGGAAAAVALLAMSIVTMHFTAMGAVHVVPGDGGHHTAATMPSYVMVAIIATVSFSLLLCGLAAALFAMRAETAVAAEQANFNMLVQGVKDYAICMLDAEGRITTWNAGAERMTRYGSADVLGRQVSLLYRSPGREAADAVVDLEAALGEGRSEVEGWRVRKDGTRFWAHVIIEPISDASGRHVGFAEITKDGTEAKEAAARLRTASTNLNVALANMANGICLWDEEKRLVLHNSKVREIFGFAAGFGLVGLTLGEIFDGSLQSRPEVEAANREFYEMTSRLFTSSGGELVQPISNGKTLRLIHSRTAEGSWVSTIEDITDRIQSEERISYLARHDMLTGLPNRGQFEDVLDEEIETARGVPGKRVAAICIDLDRFKEVNDTFGHSTGDDLLKLLSERMQEACREGEFVARFGGDEFAAIKPFADDAELDGFANRLLGALSGRTDIGGAEVVSGASIGVAIYPSDADDRDKLLSNADMAMYRSKGSLEQKISFYEAGMDEAARSRRALVRDIWKAAEDEQFYLAYQEQRDARTQDITGYEVLIRWEHPERGQVPPSVFIPVAEECGAISLIGDWVLRKACQDAARWGMRHKIAVNLSPLQLTSTGLVDRVQSILEESGLPPSLLELEVTESAIIGDKERALGILQRIRALGVTIAIDDFGTGYSSLETLRSFPFDKIKLDRSFTNGLETSRQSKAFVRAIVALGKSLEVAVLAEGVETREQMDILVEEGCDQVQGFLFGRPGRLEQVSPAGARHHAA